MGKKSFAGKFLSRLDKIDQQQIEAFLQKLIHAKDFFEIIFNRILEGIIVTDTSHRILFMNTAAFKALSLKEEPDRYAGKNLLGLINSPILRERILEFDPEAGEVISEELQIKRPRGRIIKISFLPIAGEQDDSDSIVFIINDITKQRKEEYSRIQKQRIIALTTLTAGIAHEIKNPLNSLQIHAQLLQKYMNTPREKLNIESKERSTKSIEIILEEISRLSGIVNQFLLAVRPEKITLESGNINDIIKKVVDVVELNLEKKNIDLILNLESAETESLLNFERMGQVILNLIKNAEEALENRENPEIIIRSRIDNQDMAIDFIDNGCGIPEKNMDKLFEPYFSTKFNGSGLGLIVVYRIIKEHGGNISLRSTEDEGTIVTITVPLTRRPLRLLTESMEKDETKNINS
jgi:two-component system, sporulation sensor kinase E